MLSKEKKIKMFLEVDGKCEYCGCDMILSFANHGNEDNLATFDHKYNRDHELRLNLNNSTEKRIFIVCKKCNNEKAKSEPNLQEPNGVEKKIKKLVPKEKWADEKYMERIATVLADEIEMSKKVGQCDKQIRKINHEKRVLELAISKKVRYRNQLINNLNDNIQL